MPPSTIRRRDLLSLLSGAAVAGCVPFSGSSPFWGTIGAGVKGGVSDGPSIGRAYSDKLPYASMLAWFDGSPKALLVLGEVLPDGRHVWHSAERQTITTLGAFVVAAIGFDRELRSARLEGNWQPNPLLMTGRRAVRLIDVAIDGERHQVALESRFAIGKAQDVEILDRSYRLTPVTERVSHDRRVRFKNQYWIDTANGRCWKSRQTVVPTMPPLNIEILKYPSSA